MFTTAIRLEVEKKVRERSHNGDGRDGAARPNDEGHGPASPAGEFARSDRYRLADPVFRLDEIERLLNTPRR